MFGRRADRRRVDRRDFRPTVDSRLETRILMKGVRRFGDLYGAGTIQTAYNGQAVDITTNNGEQFYIYLQYGGTVKAYAMPGGKFGLMLFGTNPQSQLTINPVNDPVIKETAHIFNTRMSQYSGMINIGAIAVVDGQIDDILGYKSAILSGPLIALGNNPIDRIAFDQIAPGAAITTGGDVNTLDVYGSVILSGTGTGINVGRDLNFFSDNGDVDIINGAQFNVGRNIGLTAQSAKGTGPSSVPSNTTILSSTGTSIITGTTNQIGYDAFQIQGSVFIAPGSSLNIGAGIGGTVYVGGIFTGVSQTNLFDVTKLIRSSPNLGSYAIVGDDFYYPPSPNSTTGTATTSVVVVNNPSNTSSNASTSGTSTTTSTTLPTSN